jgi:hypothetical protein
MAKKPTAEEIRKQKDRRAKKILLVLLPVLVALVAWQGPKVLKQVQGEETESSAPAETAATAEETVPGATSGGATTEGATTGGATTGTETGTTVPPTDPNAVAVSATEMLSDTDLPPPVDEGELIAFSRFEARDPFVQLVDGDAPSGDITEGGSSTGSSGSTSTPSTGTGTPAPSVQPSTNPTVPTTPSTSTLSEAKISVNGQVHTLKIGDRFPQTDPAFELVAVVEGQVTIGLANGTFSSGVQTITLNIGEPVTLISQPDGARFTLKLISVA